MSIDLRGERAGAAVRDRMATVRVPDAAPTVHRARRHRRRVALTLSTALVVAALGFGLWVAPTSKPAAVKVVPTNPAPSNAFGPQVRLLDAPLADVGPIVIRQDGPVTLTFSAHAGQFGLQLEHASSPGNVSVSNDRQFAPPPLVVAGGSQPDPAQGGPWGYLYGFTRPEVARIDITGPGGAASVDTFAVPEVPQLRFFLTPFDVADPVVFAVGYSADGVRLTDSHQP